MIERFWLYHCAYARLPRGAVVEDGGWQRIRFPFLAGIAEHREHGPILLDAPYGHEGPANLGSLLGSVFERFGLTFREKWSVVPRIEELGFRAADVDHVLMTHLHHDHTGGMKTLAHATFHLAAREWEFARERSGARAVARGCVPSDYRAMGDCLELYDSVPHLADSQSGLDVLGDGSIEMFWLPGHTPGHCGYRIHLEDSCVFFAGDAAFTVPQIRDRQGLGLLPKTVASSMGGIGVSLRALRTHLADHPDDVPVVCHDLELGGRCIDEGPLEIGA